MNLFHLASRIVPVIRASGAAIALSNTAFAAAEGIVELPAYTVTETRELPPPERWSYAKIDGFEVLSNSSDRATRDLVQYFRRFSQALDVVWPGARRAGDLPTALVICGRGGKFDEFVPSAGFQQFDRGTISLALRSAEQSAIVVDYEAKVLDIALPGDLAKEFEVDAHQQLSREYVRFLFGGSQAPFPAWFVEGVAQILMAMEVSKTTITVGRLEDPNLVQLPGVEVTEWDRSFNGALKNRALMPMDRLLGVTQDSEEVRNPIGSTWAKQSAAFVHWGLYGFGAKNQKAFLQFVMRSSREPVTEELFRECFKLSYKQMLDELRGYVNFTAYKMREFRAKKGEKLPDLPPLELRDATEAEVGRIKGETLRLAGHDAAARTAMIAAYMRGERDPQLLASLGLLELSLGDPTRARKFLEAAVDGKAVRPRAYLELAQFRFTTASSTASGKPLDETHAKSIVEPLLVARNQPAATAAIYELMLTTWLRTTGTPDLERLKIADEAVRRFPRNTNLIHDAAVLMQRAGRTADAAMIIKYGLSVARTEEIRARFVKLQETLPQG
jgi:hypothetical protein